MDEECIHGFGRGDCAACFPAAPVVVAPPVRKARTAPKSSLREPIGGSGTASAKSLRRPPVDVGDRRIYHVTHVANLAGIVAQDMLVPDAGDATSDTDVQVFSADERAARRSTAVPGRDTVVADHVPFSLTPNSSAWESIRAGIDDPRIDPTAAASAASEFVVLVSTIREALSVQVTDDGISSTGIVVTDGYAPGPLTRFATTSDDVQRMLVALGDEDEPDALLRAELLAPGVFPLASITLIGVANDKVRDEVRGILHAAAHKPKVAVYPPWFQAADEVRY